MPDTFLEFQEEDVSEALVLLAAIARAVDDELQNLVELPCNLAQLIGRVGGEVNALGKVLA